MQKGKTKKNKKTKQEINKCKREKHDELPERALRISHMTEPVTETVTVPVTVPD